MKRRKANGRRGNGEARTHEILERIANELVSMRKEFKGEIRTLREELKAEIQATNERIDHLIDILAPRIKNHEDRIIRLEHRRAA